MALTTSFKFRNADSTKDLNARLRRIVSRGIIVGGNVTSGVGLTVDIDPFRAVSFDGMVVLDEAGKSGLVVVDGVTNVIVVRAKYNELGSPTTPTLAYQVLEESVYNADPEKDFLIVFAKVSPPAFAVTVAAADIDFTERDEINALGRNQFRGNVANAAALPTPTSPTNRVGDFYFVDADNTFYFWTGSAWEALNTGSFNSEVSHMNDTLVQAEIRRYVDGSGVISGDRQTAGKSYSSALEVGIIEQPSIADQISVDAFSAYVNGLYVQTYARAVSLPTKPGVGTRFDLIFLEVWRESVSSPQTYAYGRNPDGSSTYDIDEVDTQGAEVLWSPGLAGNNFDLPEIESRDHAWVVTKWRLATIENVTSDALYRPGENAVASLGLNIDGNAFATPAGTGIDPRIWMADAVTTSIDDKSWAIPLLVIRRQSTEDFTIANAVKIFRSGVRHVFPVYPVVDVSHGSREMLDTSFRREPANANTDALPFGEPSGFLDTIRTYAVQSGVGANTITIKPAGQRMHVRFRGLEDWINPADDIDLGTPPGVGYERTFVYLKMNITLYADEETAPTTTPYSAVSAIHRPYIPSDVLGPSDQGWKRGFVTYTVEVANLGAANILDTDDAMANEGWSRGDLSLPAAEQYEDGGIWSRAITIDGDDRIHPHLTEWAIPLVLVHRRNSGVWNFNTNPNGTTASRPDDRTDATIIHEDDLVDLRQLADTKVDFNELLEESLDRLTKGQLRTRLANKWAGTGTGGTVAGSRILQSDHTSSTSPAAAFKMPTADNMRRMWSDAREFQVVSRSFPLNANFSDSENLIDYTSGTGQLVLRSPASLAYMVRGMPAVFYVDSDEGSGTYLEFNGPPCWSTRQDDGQAFPSPVRSKMIDTTTGATTDLFGAGIYEDFSVTATDAQGRATEMTGTVPGGPFAATDIAVLSWWVHYDRSLVAPFNGNYGLAEIPDQVWSAELNHIGGPAEELHIGTLYTTVRKTLAASTTIVITDTDVQTASGVSGTTFTLVGVDLTKIYFDGAASQPTSTTMNVARDTITITIAPAFTGDVDVVVFFRTDDVDKWIEVGRGSKSVRAIFEWNETTLDNASDPDNPAALDLGNDVWQDAEVAGDHTSMPIVWTRNGADWTLRSVSAEGYRNSNMMDIDINASGVGDQFSLVIFPVHRTLTNAIGDEFIVNYTYTPYQGLSGDGGGTVVAATALAKIKPMLHGTIEENSDFHATQSGPASYFGGVDTFSGVPARPHLPDLNNLQMTISRFGDYNDTMLVKTNLRGSGDLSHLQRGREYLNTAAVLRLPFPANPAMISGTYHLGVMEFDLDPGREGASAGFFSYAPGYPGATTLPAVGHTALQRDQYVNGLTRLAVRGEAKQQTESTYIPASTYGFREGVATVDLGIAGIFSISGAGAVGQFWGRVDTVRGSTLARALIRATVDKEPPTPTAGRGTGVDVRNVSGPSTASDRDTTAPASYLLAGGTELLKSSVNAIVDGVSSQDVFICCIPGSILQYLQSADLDNAHPVIQSDFSLGGAPLNNFLFGTHLLIDSERSVYRHGQNPHESTTNVDLIRLPLSSGNSRSISEGRHISSRTSLRGLLVEYPSTWSGSVLTSLEAFWQASTTRRGLYYGSTEIRQNLPMLVPGSGTELSHMLQDGSVSALLDIDDTAPLTFPYMPADPIFASSNRMYDSFDHGGPIAYVFYSVVINPTDDDLHGRAVMQISGGPTGPSRASAFTTTYTPDDLDGTAIDAFWPLYRPLIKSGD
jgi:hypothetical protein